ncbi:MAG: SWIM zinc finger family protein, partial [Acetobacteraceae bacterium]|nr:SWIM zinc finger family protein [Acetobacteraceae bacterium]
MAFLSLDDIRRTVSQNAFIAGLVYQKHGHVRSMSISKDGRLLEAHVIGSAPAPYRLSIRLKERSGGGAVIAGTCSCPVGFNCKHVAAALFAA